MINFSKEITDLRYISYSSGRYSNGRHSGITLAFESEETGNIYYAIFNVELHRLRTTKRYAAGDPLPKNQFRIGKRHEFYKLWKRLGLKMPPRLSSFHDYMGNLKSCVLSGLARRDGKLANKSLILTSFNDASVLDAEWPSEGLIQSIYGRQNDLQAPDTRHTISRHPPDNCHTSLPYKESAETSVSIGHLANQSGCSSKCEKRYQGSANKEDKGAEACLEAQGHEEWLRDYNRAEEENSDDVPF